MINRRQFLQGSALAISGILLAEAIPVNRVYSFPKIITCLNRAPIITNLHIPDRFWESGDDYYTESDFSLAKMEALTPRQERRLLAALELFKSDQSDNLWPRLTAV